MDEYSGLMLTDCDGVLLNWKSTFIRWMKKHDHHPVIDHDTYDLAELFGLDNDKAYEYMHIFNESAWMKHLPVYKDAIYYVDLLHRKHGYRFHIITSLTRDEYAGDLRKENLRYLFGEGVFEKFIFLSPGEGKKEALEEYKDSGCYWIEDHAKNALDGYELGLQSILIAHKHNSEFQHPHIPRLDSWKEVYAHII